MNARRFSQPFMSICLLLITASALGHHGWSSYDTGKTLTLTGVVKNSGYEHPHGFIKLQVTDKLWLAVLAPPARMETRGLARDALKAGNEVTVVGYQHRSETNEMRAERIIVGDKTVELR